MSDRIEQARQRYESDTKKHEARILHDDGLYRHVRIQTPGTWMYGHDLVTWPGYLAITGDAGEWTFSRVPDMMTFFESDHGGINPHYWSEKLCGRGIHDDAREYSPERFKERVLLWHEERSYDLTGEESIELRKAIDRELLARSAPAFQVEARALLDNFEFNGHRIESWEWDLKDWNGNFLWCCWAIVRGIARYRELTTEVAS